MPAPSNYTISFAVVKKRFASLERILLPYMGQRLADDTFEQLVDRCARHIGLKVGSQICALRDLLTPYHGYLLSQTIRHEMLWRMAASWERLQWGSSIGRRFEAHNLPWMGLMIEDIRYRPGYQADKPRYELTLRVVDGYFAGLSFQDTLSAKWVRFKFAREIGFARFKPLNIRELVGCCFLGSLDLTDPLRPHLDEFDTKCGVLSRNRDLRKLRSEPCPAGYSWACHDCPIGTTICQEGQTVCYRATHRATYTTKLCPRCNLIQEYDPLSNVPICLVCEARDQAHSERAAQMER